MRINNRDWGRKKQVAQENNTFGILQLPDREEHPFGVNRD